MNKKCYLMSSVSFMVLTDSLSLLLLFFSVICNFFLFKIAFQQIHNSFLCSTGSYMGNAAGAKLLFPSKLSPHQDSKIYGHSVCLTFFCVG